MHKFVKNIVKYSVLYRIYTHAKFLASQNLSKTKTLQKKEKILSG